MSTYEANRYNFDGANLSIPSSAIPNLDTAKITTGTFADARLAATNITQHVTLPTEVSGGWTLNPIVGAVTVHSGKYVRIGKLCQLTAWGKGNGGTYNTGNFNNSRFYFTGAPITSMNTGTASDCVGIGTMCLRKSHVSIGTHQVWILSNSTQIRVGLLGRSRMKAADSNHTNSATQSGSENAEFNINRANIHQDLEPGDNSHWAFQLTYFVD